MANFKSSRGGSLALFHSLLGLWPFRLSGLFLFVAIASQVSGQIPEVMDQQSSLTFALPSFVSIERTPQSQSAITQVAPTTIQTTAPSFAPPLTPIGATQIRLSTNPKGDSNETPLSIVDRKSIPQMIDTSTSLHENDSWMGVRPVSAEVPYQPLYFEQVNLERYGRNHGCLQPALSGARFFATIPLLPYAMTVHPPRQAYDWHWPYAAGWGAPRVREWSPLHWRGVAVEGAFMAGAAALIP